VEDAFYAFRDIDDKELDERLNELPDDYDSGDIETDRLMDKFTKDIENSNKACERWSSCEDPGEKLDALCAALQMIENQKKYGYPCIEWWPD
jgi:hypothetical protein